MRNWFLMLAWVAGRAVLLWLLTGPQTWVTGDTVYYERSLASLGADGLGGTLVEYPLPAVGVVALPWLVALSLELPYAVVLVGLAVLTDLAFTLLLVREDRAGWSTAIWVVGVPLLGATAYARFDLLPGVLCGAGVLLLARAPRAAAGCVAVATAVKLWPALLLPPLLAAVRPRRPPLLVVLGVGAATAGGTVLAAGWWRLFTPLAFQADRGLQIESVPATPLLAAWALTSGEWHIGFAPSNSYEITGPGVGVALAASAVLSIGYVVALVLCWAWLWRVRDSLSRTTAVWVALASVSGFLVVGKVLSPQYLLWLLPIAVGGLAVTRAARLRLWTGLLVPACALTQVVFPANYEALTGPTGQAGLVVLVLAGRNALLVSLVAIAAREAWARLRTDSQRGRELERHPGEPAEPGVRTSR